MATLPSAIELPIDPNADPNRPRLDEALETIERYAAADAFETPRSKLLQMAQATGDISAAYSAEKLVEIGATCCANYDRDKQDRKEWEDVAREAIAACSQEEASQIKDFPWKGSSQMKWPLLTTAVLQFNARMYPAIIKGDEAVLCKVIGQDNGMPVMAPNPMSGQIQPVPQMTQDPQTGQPTPVLDEKGEPVPQWAIEPGEKAKRARRVSEYLNTVIFYREESWEDDTDALLIQLPAAGCVFRKRWMDGGKSRSATVSALNLVVPNKSRNLETALRITEEIENVYPHEIVEKQRSGVYRDINLALPDPNKGGESNDGARLLLEQHCRWDFDEDGLSEPYIVTLDYETRLVLRIEPNFGPDDIVWAGVPAPTGQPVEGLAPAAAPEPKAAAIKPRRYYVKYGMFPHPDGKFYDIGLGHLLKRLTDTIDTTVNQMLDAGTAAAAGGGFIGAGVRLQSRGNRGVVTYEPGKYKTVDVPGDDLRRAIVERTLPQVSPVTFQVLELVLGAARDIAGAKDVITGEAPNTGQVGTTLALIEQGLQVFNAAAKRIFRMLKTEFELLFYNIGTFGGAEAKADYESTIDDPEANFEKDFQAEDLDIRPVSDPSSITRMQKMAKAQFRLNLMPQIIAVGGDGREVIRRTLEAIDEEDIEKILPPPPPPDPMQQQMAMQGAIESLRKLSAEADKLENQALKEQAEAALTAVEAQAAKLGLSLSAGQIGMEMGAQAAQIGAPDGNI